MKNKRLLIMLFGMIFFSAVFVTADLGKFNVDSCVQLATNLNATQVNISNVILPNQTAIQINEPMNTPDGYYYYYNFCNNSIVGNYLYNYYDNNGETYTNSYSIYNSTAIYENTPAIMKIDLSSPFVIAIIIFLLGFAIFLWVIDQPVISAVIFILIGFTLLLNNANLLISLILIVTGVGLGFKKQK